MRSTKAVTAPRAAEEAARETRVQRTAWALGLLAVFFYLGFIAWNLLRGSLG
jgi:uncharacterized membrane protein